ncbi:MAG: hypothetical protein V1495_02030 [Pseudomonadota bacterium]
MTKLKMKLGELLVEAGLANRREIDNALQAQLIFGDRLGTNLIELGVIDADTLAGFLSRQFGVPRVTREEFEGISGEIICLIPHPAAARLCLVPLRKENGRLVVAMLDPGEQRILDRIAKNVGMPVEPRVATELEIRYYLEQYYKIPREARQIALMRAGLGRREMGEPSFRNLAKHLDRHGTAAETIRFYFDEIRSLDRIPVRNTAHDLRKYDLTPELTFVLHHIDGYSSLREILMASVFSRIATLQAIVYFAKIALVRFEEV